MTTESPNDHDRLIAILLVVVICLAGIGSFFYQPAPPDQAIDLDDVCNLVKHAPGEYDQFSCTDGDHEIIVTIHPQRQQ